ncbi:hypothetical protein JXB22_05295 [candidate division WOR-3 bacterium]|nr:hypothetical protein [candidate division WOR-3 bacterium]
MKILPVAFESMGVRSMATYVETNDLRIFIDPGVSVSPDRYSMPPHTVELDRRRDMLESVKEWAGLSDVVIITHYHYDHHNPDEICLYKGKDILLKHPREHINQSQKQRAATLLGLIEPCARSVRTADSQEFIFGNTRIVFSPPLLHGNSPALGYVVGVLIEDDQKFLYTSDVQGPMNQEVVDFVIAHQPATIILDGPPTYQIGSHYKKSDINQAFENIKKIISATSIKSFIIDHHLLRDLNWQDYVSDLSSVKPATKICSAAEYLGKKVDILEARRKELYGGQVCV